MTFNMTSDSLGEKVYFLKIMCAWFNWFLLICLICCMDIRYQNIQILKVKKSIFEKKCVHSLISLFSLAGFVVFSPIRTD